jgi:hypothetical protein
MVTVNIHPVERVVRGIVGLFILSLVVWGPRSYWGLIGIVPLATALVGWCPPYSLLGISTCPKKAGA